MQIFVDEIVQFSSGRTFLFIQWESDSVYKNSFHIFYNSYRRFTNKFIVNIIIFVGYSKLTLPCAILFSLSPPLPFHNNLRTSTVISNYINYIYPRVPRGIGDIWLHLEEDVKPTLLPK